MVTGHSALGSWRVCRARIQMDACSILWLAWPLILTNFAHVALTTLDIVFLGVLGPLDLAAGGIALALLGQLRAIGNGLVTAIGNLAAQSVSDGEREQLRGLVPAGMLLVLFAGIPSVGLSLVMEGPLIWLGQEPDVAARAAEFLKIAAPGLMPAMGFEVLRHHTAGLKQPGPLLAITLVSVGLSGLLNYCLALGGLGFTALGLRGVAFATLIVPTASFTLLACATRGKKSLRKCVDLAPWRAERKVVIQIAKLGVPIAATYGSEAGFFSVVTLLIGTLGVEALAAQTVVNQVVYIVFMISSGISYSVSLHISEACTARHFEHARRLCYTAIGLGLTGMAAIAASYFTTPVFIVRLFMTTPEGDIESLNLAVAGLSIAAVLQVFDCSQSVANGSLRGLGDTTIPLKLSLLGYWAVGLPAAYLLGVSLGLGAQGVWMGLTLGLAATAALLLLAFEVQLAQLIEGRTSRPLPPTRANSGSSS